MSDDYQRIEVITGAARRRRWTTEEKLRIVDETLRSGESISIAARRHGVAPNLLYRWRRLMAEDEPSPRHRSERRWRMRWRFRRMTR